MKAEDQKNSELTNQSKPKEENLFFKWLKNQSEQFRNSVDDELLRISCFTEYIQFGVNCIQKAQKEGSIQKGNALFLLRYLLGAVDSRLRPLLSEAQSLQNKG